MTRSKLKQPNYSLSRIAIMATLSKESREKLEQRCAWRRYERGEPIVDITALNYVRYWVRADHPAAVQLRPVYEHTT